MTASIKMAWRRQPSEKGLASVGQGERGWDLWLGKIEKVAYVRPCYRSWSREKVGYYCVVRSDLPGMTIILVNTAADPATTIEQAVKDAEAHVKQHIPDAKINRAALTKAGISLPG